ncbi:MAG: FAD-dependent oxidoreductase, partial [Planctomycetota bacterium]
KGPHGGVRELAAALETKARYLKLAVEKADDAPRLLLGEILVIEQRAAAAPEPTHSVPVRPMHVKKALEDALLDAGVDFLFGCYPTDVLRDRDGELAGIVMANRAGRQAVVAKTIIDATPDATVARLAGAGFRGFRPGPHAFKRVVIGGEPQEGKGIANVRTIRSPFIPGGRRRRTAGRGPVDLIEYTLTLPLESNRFAALAEAEQAARDLTFVKGQLGACDSLFRVPDSRVQSRRKNDAAAPFKMPAPDASTPGPWVRAFRPAEIGRLFVLSGRADVGREAAEVILRPPALIRLGSKIGEIAAAEAERLSDPKAPRVAGAKGANPAAAGDVLELLGGVRPGRRHPTVRQPERSVPVLGAYDVVVVGGGTSGAPAAIGAARAGAKTLVVEYLHGLGGVSTLGLIGRYYHGYRGGFTRAVPSGRDVPWKMEWYRREIRNAGGDIWFGTMGVGAFVEDAQVKGVVVATPRGRGVVLARAVIDSTGNADIAAAAGAACTYTDGSHIAVQGAGLPPRELGANYTNTDYVFADDGDPADITHLFLYARRKYRGAFDLAQIVDTRERRRVVGDYTLSPLDQMSRRTFPDSVVWSRSNFDTHGFTVHPLFLLIPTRSMHGSVRCYTPYRCLLPKGLDGLLVTGLGTSVHRDAMPFVRMQPDLQNQGYAAGRAAAMAARLGGHTRKIDVRSLQKHLVEKGNLPKAVLAHQDSFPIPKAEVADAVRSLGDRYRGLPVVLARQKVALPLLRRAHDTATDNDAKLVYAEVLGILGDAAGVETLADAVRSAEWDRGWNFRGMGQYGRSLSRLDTQIIALGRTGDKRALRPLLQKLDSVHEKPSFSHCRALAMAFETLGDSAAARPLAGLLRRPGMSGHAVTKRLVEGRDGRKTVTRSNRNECLRELVLARALYRCGDHDGLGERILRTYTRDLRGHFARHATAVLKSNAGASDP